VSNCLSYKSPWDFKRGLKTQELSALDRTFLAVNPLSHQVVYQMKHTNFIRALDVFAAAALLAGCSGAQPPLDGFGQTPLQAHIRAATVTATIPELRPTLPRPGYKARATAPLLYATNVGFEDVTVYQAKANDPLPLATISDGLLNPSGACIDGEGTLYVTNEPASGGWVSEYPLGKTTPSRMITDGINEPGYCAIDANGNLWVSNIYGPNVTEYLKGSKRPHTVITNGLVYPVGVAIDRSGNLYVGNGNGADQKNVQVYAPGSKSPLRRITSGITSPMGLAVDSSGVLYVPNLNQNNVAEFRSGQSVPFQTITAAIVRPGGVAVDKRGTLYVSNIGNSTVVEFARGSLTPLKRQISSGLYEPEGIGYYPALLP
jgi:sugar lactone lactonase YvrE